MRRRRALHRSLLTGALLAAFALPSGEGRTEGGIRVSGELSYTDSKDDVRNKQTAEEIDTDLSTFRQLYNIEFARRIFPYVDLRTGALLTRDNARTETEDQRLKFSDGTGAYFVELKLESPDYRAGMTYRDTREETDGTNLADLDIFRESYTGFAHWEAEALPSLDVNYRHSRFHDKPRTRETVVDFWNLNSRYDYGNLRVDYTYTRNDRDERLQDFGQLDSLHDGRVGYTTSILGGRVSVRGGSELTYRTADPSGGESVRLPLPPPGQTFFLLDDSTPDSNLPGEFTTVDAADPLTSVDIGPSGPQNLVSFGVQFPSPTRADTVHVLPLEDATDPSLSSPAEIETVAELFSWQVFSSDDQENWTEIDVTRARYDVFENRFEISFSASMDVRFLKLVTRPLSGGGTRSILVSALEFFETAGTRPGETVRSFRQTYNLGLSSDLSSDTRSFYDLYYQIEDVDPSTGRRTLLTNSIGLNHRFSPTWTGTTRYLRSTSRTPDVDSVQNSFVASLRAKHLPTFSQTLTYSALYDHDDESSTNTNSIWLRNTAELHPRWSASLDLGYVRRSPDEEPTSYGPTLRLISSLDPNPRMNFRVDYTFSLSKEKHERTRREHRWSLQALFVPTDRFSMFANLSFNDDGLDGHRFSQNYSVSWAPFRDGAIDLALRYGRFEDRMGRREETITPELRWQIRPGLLGILSYRIGSRETDIEERDTNVFTAELDFSFR